MLSYLPYLLTTIGVELAVVALLARLAGRPIPWVDVLVLNLLTHPIATAVYQSGLAGFWTVETGVVLAEWAGYAWLTRVPGRTAFTWSAIANGVTIALSFVLP